MSKEKEYVINMRERTSVCIKKAQKRANELKKAQKLQFGSKIILIKPDND